MAARWVETEVLVSDRPGHVIRASKRLRRSAPTVLIRPLVLGLCGTDLDIIRGARDDHPSILGHEGVGLVIHGDSEGDVELVGKCVVFNPVNPGNPTEVLGHSVDGVFSTLLAFPSAASSWRPWVTLSPGITPALGCLAEPLGVTLYGWDIAASVRSPDKTVIVGAGAIGQIYALTAGLLGCQEVVLVDTSEERLLRAEASGVVERGSSIHAEPRTAWWNNKRLREPADLGVLCVPRESGQAAIRGLLACVRNEGLVDLVGGFVDGFSIPANPRLRPAWVRRQNNCGHPNPPAVSVHELESGRRVVMFGHRGTHTTHLERAMALLERFAAEYGRLISDRVAWPNAADWLTLMSGSGALTEPPSGGKTIIDFEVMRKP